MVIAGSVPFPSPQLLLPPEEIDDVASMVFPPLRPGGQPRDVIYRKEDMILVDTHVVATPVKAHYGSLKTVVNYLTSMADMTDIQKLWALYRWITQSPHGLSQTVSPEKMTEKSSASFLSMVHSGMVEFALVMAAICHIAGIPCYIVSGCKREGNDPFTEFSPKVDWNLKKTWNVVHVSGGWYILDAKLSSQRLQHTDLSCSPFLSWTPSLRRSSLSGEEEREEPSRAQNTEHFFFLANPEHMKWIYHPVEDDKLQVCKQLATASEFESHYLVQESFYLLELTDIPETTLSYYNEVDNGKFTTEFGLQYPLSRDLKFDHSLFRHGQGKQKRRYVDDTLNSYVFREYTNNSIKLSVRLPIEGLFSLELRGIHKEDPDYADDLCCKYILSAREKEPCMPLPDNPSIGWGFVPGHTDHWLNNVLPERAEVKCRSGVETIRLSKAKPLNLFLSLKHCTMDAGMLSNYSLTDFEDNEAVVYVRLPVKGEYALAFHALEQEKEGDANNVLNYLLNTEDASPRQKPFPNVTTGALGPSQHSADEFKAVSHSKGMVTSPDGQLSLKFESAKPLVAELHAVDGNALGAKHQTFTHEGSRWQLDLELPVKGEYALNVFSKEEEDAVQLHHVYSYLITSDNAEGLKLSRTSAENLGTIPTEIVTIEDRQVSLPLPTSTGAGYAAAIHRRDGYDPPGSNSLKVRQEEGRAWVDSVLESDGEYMLTLFATEDFWAETLKRYILKKGSPKAIDMQALSDDIGLGLTPPVQVEVKPRVEVKPKVTVERKPSKAPEPDQAELRATMFRHSVKPMGPDAIRELKSYKQPPLGVFETVKAAFLLLGYAGEDVKTWLKIQGLLNRTGNASVLKEVENFKPEEVSAKTVSKAEKLLVNIDLAAIHDASAGAASFYVWTTDAIEKVKKYLEGKEAEDKKAPLAKGHPKSLWTLTGKKK